jgi:hypothetical protein
MNQFKTIISVRCCVIAASLLLLSCKKEESTQSVSGQPVTFKATYDTNTATKASQPFPEGNKASIFAYTSGSSPATASMVAGTPLEATAQSSGVLTPESQLYLPKGSYDFYSVSANNSTTPGLTFTNGISGILSNSKDYLWATHSSVQEGGVVNFSYTHSATLMEFNITAGSGVSSLQVTSLKFTPSKPESTSVMELANGSVSPCSQKEVLTETTLSGNTGRFIMLPLQSLSLDVQVTINAVIGDTPVTGKIYTASVPSQSYNAGTHYTINMSVSASSLSFTGSVIEDWATQTISGISLEEQ